MELKRYDLRITFTEPLLGSAPCSPEVYKQFIESKKPDAITEDESANVAEREEKGWTVFRSDENGIFLYDYVLRGFLKEAAAAMTGTKSASEGMAAYKTKINRWLFVLPRKLYLYQKANNAFAPAKTINPLERPLRAMTMQGPRVTLARSDQIEPGAFFTAKLIVLPLGQSEITVTRLLDWLSYGALNGIGQWRTGSYGRFEFDLKSEA